MYSIFLFYKPVQEFSLKYERDGWRSLAGLVAQSNMSATDTLGHRDVRGLSATDPCPRQWICVCTMPKDVGMPS